MNGSWLAVGMQTLRVSEFDNDNDNGKDPLRVSIFAELEIFQQGVRFLTPLVTESPAGV